MKYVKIIVLFIIMLSGFLVDASSGSIRQSSVIKCGSKYYGSHGSPMHWHIVEKKDGKWVSVSDEVDEPSCYADIPNEKVEVKFNKCVDGDTVKVNLDGEVKTVRFLAIDTPESVHPEKEVEAFGKEASDYTCNLVKNAKKLYLEYDKNSDKEDKYGRQLAYVYADDLMVQKELIKVGYAKVAYLYADYTYTDELKDLEKTAKEKEIGIWSDENVSRQMDDEANGDISDNTNNKTSSKNSILDKIFDLISKFIDKLIDKIFDLF